MQKFYFIRHESIAFSATGGPEKNFFDQTIQSLWSCSFALHKISSIFCKKALSLLFFKVLLFDMRRKKLEKNLAL